MAEWFYADGDKPVGPVALDGLVAFLRATPNPSGTKVWQPGFEDWRNARDVPQLADALLDPPPVPGRRKGSAPDSTRATVITATDRDRAAPKGARGRIAFLVVLLFVLAAGATLSTLVYGNSVYGIAYLVGQLFAVTALTSLLALPMRRSTYFAAGVLGFSALVIGFGNWALLRDAFAIRDGRATLERTGPEPGRLDRALEKQPSNVFLQWTAEAIKASEEAAQRVKEVSESIEPSALAKEVDPATATRAELEAYHHGLKTAESNAKAAIPRIAAILKDERDRVERFGRSLGVSNEIAGKFLGGIDSRQAKHMALAERMMAARTELYRVYGNSFALMIEQFGNYRMDPNGQFIVPTHALTERFNEALKAVQVAVGKVSELERETEQLAKAQEETWNRLMSGR